MEYLDKEGLNTLVNCVKEHVNTSIKDRYSHVVVEKNVLVTSKLNNSINEYTISCLLNGKSIKAISLSDISSTEYQNTRKAIWTKSAEHGNCYAGILSISSSACSGVLKLSINNNLTKKSETHYICFIADTPSSGTFLFMTTCEWNIETRYKNYSLYSYLEVPSTFSGTISIEFVRYSIIIGGNIRPFNYSYGGSPYCTDGYTELSSAKLYTDGLSIDMSLIESEPYGDILTPDNFLMPFGYHKTDIIYDFGNINVGDKISDAVINDCLLHDIDKRISSITDLLNQSTTKLEMDDHTVEGNIVFLTADETTDEEGNAVYALTGEWEEQTDEEGNTIYQLNN